jgi:hypothetical protein
MNTFEQLQNLRDLMEIENQDERRKIAEVLTATITEAARFRSQFECSMAVAVKSILWNSPLETEKVNRLNGAMGL